MKDYFKEAEFTLELIYFHYHGNCYRGKGFMTWNPDLGFHLKAFVDSKNESTSKIDLGRIGITRKSDFCSIRMRSENYDWALAPNVRLSDQDEVSLQQGHLSISFGRVIFCESITPSNGVGLWHGSAFYETKSKLHLSDTVHVETRINNGDLERRWSMSGISYTDSQSRSLIGNLIDDKKLRLYWKLPRESWTKAETWQWAIAIQDSLSLYFGETIWLLKREFCRDTQKITEVRKRVKLDSLGLLSPLGNLDFNKDIFIKLADFFIRKPFKADICRRIFLQLVEASRQQSLQARELLLSTILEASLRSIDCRAFTPKKDRAWNVGRSLEDFFNTYLISEEWTVDVRKKIMEAHCYLRDRNAHPDWLFAENGNLSEESRTKSLDSMILLSRFYGYMILALAEFEGLKPIFPQPHQDWDAIAVVTTPSTDVVDAQALRPDIDMLEEQSGLKTLMDKLSEAKTYHDRTMVWRKFKRSM